MNKKIRCFGIISGILAFILCLAAGLIVIITCYDESPAGILRRADAYYLLHSQQQIKSSFVRGGSVPSR